MKLACQKRLSVLKATHRAMKASEIRRVDEEGVGVKLEGSRNPVFQWMVSRRGNACR